MITLKSSRSVRKRTEERERERERERMENISTVSETIRNPSFLLEETLEDEEMMSPRIRFKEKNSWSMNKKNKKKNQVFLEGYVEAGDEEDQEQGLSKGVSRTMSLTDEDLDELKGCVDLGFGFSYEEIPELCNTLPALELCYSMSQRFMDEKQKSPEASASSSSPMATDTCSSPGPIANWKISSPGDHPEEVKARLKFWAQAVACTVKLCS